MSKYLLLLLLVITPAANADELDIVTRFIHLSDKTKVVGASREDILAVAELLSEDMRYQHPSYNQDLTKSQFIEGLTRYMGTAESLSTEVKSRIEGKGAIAISYVSTLVRNGNEEVDPTPLMRLFELENDKITLIREYW